MADTPNFVPQTKQEQATTNGGISKTAPGSPVKASTIINAAPSTEANPVVYSTHQRGIAVDLNNKQDTSEGGINWWMERNAYKYGFVRTYTGFAEGHHWEYRPSEVTQPAEIDKAGKKYTKYTFATFKSETTEIWSRSYVLDPVKKP